MTIERLVAGVDVGGTNIEVGLVGPDHEVVDRAKSDIPTGGPDAVMGRINELVQSLSEPAAAVGVGFPGVVHRGKVLTVPNLANWFEPVDVGSVLNQMMGVPVAVGNDADVGLLGEWYAGAARGVDNVLGVWMGTGIGGSFILDGRPFNGSRGGAGEIGHIIVRPGGALCGCGRRGCIEAYAGRRMMSRAATELVEAGRTTSLFDLRDQMGKQHLTSRVWARALEDGDAVATELVDLAIETLGIGLGSVVNATDVELVVIGGGFSQKLGQPLADRIGRAAAPWTIRPNPDLRWVRASLGDSSGVVGAASIGRAELRRAG